MRVEVAVSNSPSTDPTPTVSLDDLDSNLLQLVLQHLDLEDLCRVARVSRRFRTVVNTADSAWASLYAREFGGVEPAAQLLASQRGVAGWRHTFKERCIRDRDRRRLVRQAKLMRLQSSLQVLEVQVHKARGALRGEAARRSGLQRQLGELRKARSVQAALQCWQPLAVQQQHSRVVAQAPVEPEWRERQLAQELAVSQL